MAGWDAGWDAGLDAARRGGVMRLTYDKLRAAEERAQRWWRGGCAQPGGDEAGAIRAGAVRGIGRE